MIIICYFLMSIQMLANGCIFLNSVWLLDTSLMVAANTKPYCNHDCKDSCCPRWHQWWWHDFHCDLYWWAYEKIRTMHWWRAVVNELILTVLKCGILLDLLTLELVLKSSLITFSKCNQEFTSSSVSLCLHCLLA